VGAGVRRELAVNLELPRVADDDVLVPGLDEMKAAGLYFREEILKRRILLDIGNFSSDDVSVLGGCGPKDVVD
jgi:hypothetical protein